MALTARELQDLNARIGWLLDKHLAPIFKPGTQISFIARTPGNDEADVLVTTERDLNEVVALVLRSLGRAAIGAGVDSVPRAAGTDGKTPDQLRQDLRSGQWDWSEVAEKPGGAAGKDLPDGAKHG